MKRIIFIIPILFFILFLSDSVYSQRILVGGPCEGCEAIFEYGEKKLTPIDIMPDFKNPGPKIKVTGTIYNKDGLTPAADVILYVYHTNQQGIYETRGGETGWARRHGYIRGWIKTDHTGTYTLYSLKPGSYPGRSEPAHIHATILEPNGCYYYIDSYHFENDPLLTQREREKQPKRGGSGIVKLEQQDDVLVAKRDIILGKNIPGYD